MGFRRAGYAPDPALACAVVTLRRPRRQTGPAAERSAGWTGPRQRPFPRHGHRDDNNRLQPPIWSQIPRVSIHARCTMP